MKNQWWHCQTCGTYFRSPVWKTECFRCGGDQPPPLSRYEIIAGVALALTVIAMLWVMGCHSSAKCHSPMQEMIIIGAGPSGNDLDTCATQMNDKTFILDQPIVGIIR